MADVHEPAVRSYNMSRIKSKDTKPEILVRKFLFSKGFRYRVHVNKLPGKPDIVLKRYNSIIFIHGCFWHKHNDCKYFVIPKTRTKWWLDKINRNVENDLKNYNNLEELGWNIITIWECELKPKRREGTLNNLIKLLKNEFIKTY
jgi:DNA mismatch endonuclease (patch repair protein)